MKKLFQGAFAFLFAIAIFAFGYANNPQKSTDLNATTYQYWYKVDNGLVSNLIAQNTDKQGAQAAEPACNDVGEDLCAVGSNTVLEIDDPVEPGDFPSDARIMYEE